MKLLITGTNGFLGRNLKEFFLKKDFEISTPKRQQLNLLDSSLVEDYINENNFDVVIHSSVTLDSIDENLKMYFNLEKLSNKYGKLICIGSGAEFNSKYYEPKMKEEYFGKHMPDKSDIYGYSKFVIAKDILKKKRNIFNLRVFGIFGKYEDYRRRFISNNICRLLINENISINKNMFFDYLYVDDFLKIMELFILSTPKHSTYNTCTGKKIDLLTIAKILNEIDGRNKDIFIKNEGTNKEYTGENSRLINEFNEIKFTDPEKSILNLYNWYKNESKLIFDKNIFDKWIKN